MTKRVLIAGFKHETNTFSILPTTLQSYEARGYVKGAAIAPFFRGTNTEIAAFLDGCAKYGWEPVLSVAADATPSGKLTRDCYETIAGAILADVERAGKLDAVLLNLHGAMVAEHTDDGEGMLLERLRARVGRDVVIAATLDLHANVTKAMVEYADILVSYRTYPHIDMYEVASEAVEIVKRALDGEVTPKTYLARRAQLYGADDGRTTSPGPMTKLLERCAKIKASDSGVLALSINAGFAWADIPEVGPTAVLVGDGSDPRFQAYAESLANDIWEGRHRRTVTFLAVAEALARARAVGRVGKPAVLADFADNPGGGGYGDTTGLLRGMIEAGLESAAMAAFYDPEAAAACHKVGVGATLTLQLGGKVDPRFGAPIEAAGTVTHVSDGRMTIEGPMMRGVGLEMGPTATFKIGGVEVVIISRRFQNYDRNFFRAGGIEPAERAILAVKSSQHFRAAYAPIASEVIIVDEGGGVMSNDLTRLPFTRVPRPIFPLDLD
ncbi:MAG: M81 family metallopeptidase [Hyphomicrobiaceae bacterium]